jgi:hypothetical protein
VANLKANSTQPQNETLSEELKRFKDLNSQLSIRNLELVGKNSLLEEKNETLVKEAKDFREKLERLKKEIQDVWENHYAILESALKSGQRENL